MGLARNKRTRRAARPNVKVNTKTHDKVGNDIGETNPLVSEESLQPQGVIRLTKRDWEQFLALMEADAQPNDALLKAIERFKRSGL